MSAMSEDQLREHANSFYYRQAIGPRAEYYLAQFEKFYRAGDRWVATWNWPAFFFSSAWFAYRRMNGYSLLNYFLPLLVVVGCFLVNQSASQFLIVGGYLVFAYVVVPTYANALYYRDLKYRVARVAASDGNDQARALLRPPSVKSAFTSFLTAICIFGIPWIILSGISGHADYGTRARVADSIAAATSLKTAITEFHVNNKRFPAQHEAEKFRINSSQYTQAIGYDAEKRMIVVTMGTDHSTLKDKRYALHAEVKDGVIAWTCRTIDLEQKYLPSACRR